MSSGGHGPEAARHLVGHVQRFGLASAAAIVERYVEVVDRALGGHGPLGGSEHGRDPDWLADGVVRLVDAGVRALETLASLASFAPGGQHSGHPDDQLVLPATCPGGVAEASLWVHNPGSSSAVDVHLRATSLTSPTGVTIPEGAVSLSRSRVAVVDAHGPEEIRFRVDVPAGQPAGPYHGLVLSPAAPSEPLPVRLEVLENEGSG